LAYLCIIFILLSNGSRGALLAVLVALITLTILAEHASNRVIGGVLLLAITTWIGLGMSGRHMPSFVDAWSEETCQEWRVKMDLDWDGETNSLLTTRVAQGMRDASRADIWKACGEEIVDSHLLGVGAANYVCALQKHPDCPYLAPHNLFLEVLLQFGIVVFAGFMVFLLWPFWRCRKDKTVRHDCLTILIILLPLTIVDSTFLLKAHTWMIIATLYLLTRQDDRVVD
jgi:O-antigen ligase